MKKNVQDITLLGLMTSIIIIMTAVPGIGFIPIGPVNATIVHIPVVIIGIVKGPKLGAILGTIMGVASMINALLRPTPTSFLFMNPIIAILPRMLIGLVTGYTAVLLRNRGAKYKLDKIIPAALGSMTNTVGVLSLIYIIYASAYMETIGRTGQSALKFLLGIASVNGVIELLVCVVISTPIAYALKRYEKKR